MALCAPKFIVTNSQDARSENSRALRPYRGPSLPCTASWSRTVGCEGEPCARRIAGRGWLVAGLFSTRKPHEMLSGFGQQRGQFMLDDYLSVNLLKFRPQCNRDWVEPWPHVAGTAAAPPLCRGALWPVPHHQPG